ncbi:hypothetical protein [Clavibacter michiganensis]|uniref:hypothetical protein n=1 Tax=Clavibacter michiganensis TaxID=28447 RepID=UPI00118492E7|nr:hypothetical protein [Clavibacter michiganensis]
MTPGEAHAATTRDIDTIASSLKSGTLPEDIVNGRISVEELVDADLASRAVETSYLSRDEVTREVTKEVDGLKAGHLEEVSGVNAGSRATGDPLGANLSLWKKFKHLFKHWFTVTLDTSVILLVASGGAGVAGASAGALAIMGLAAWAIVYAGIAAGAGVLAGVAFACNRTGHQKMRIAIPDLKNSHCLG